MKITLLYPPIDDPTMPYHGNAHLLGTLRANGFADATTRDLNVEFVNFCMEEAVITEFHAERERRLASFATYSELSFAEQDEYLTLWQYEPIPPHKLTEAMQQLRCKESFLDYNLYTANVELIQRYFRFMGHLSFPGEIFNFQYHARGRYNIYTLNDLFDYELSDSLNYCFSQFFEQRLAGDPELLQTDIFGVSIIYDYQLVPALWLARALKTCWPHRRVVLGGTAMSQVYKYMKNKLNMVKFFEISDAIVVGEGESAIYGLASCTGPWDRAAAIPNTITYDRETHDLCFPSHVHYEQLVSFGPPIYEFPWHLYLSPERGINYSPTRGCYWNRCTFCDYGLNTDRPTSPWRERSIDQVVDDLGKVLTDHQIDNVYFAVDVMAPGYLERLSEAIVKNGFKFHWSAELRMEKIFSPDRCEKMVEAGMVCASFGMESGNQRILDLIDKGTKVEYMEETLKNFARAGVAVQLMTFHGFPTETREEKAGTIEFIQRTRDYWATGGFGTFQLTGGAIVARKPELFGITLLGNDKVDVGRSVDYFVDGAEERGAIFADDYDATFDDNGGFFPSALGRPWAGGIDSLHSMIYYATYGSDFFKKHDLRICRAAVQKESFDKDATIEFNAKLAFSMFDLTRIVANRRMMKTHLVKSPKGQTPIVTYRDYKRSDHGLSERLRTQPAYWILNETKGMKLDKATFDLLQSAVNAPVTVSELLSTAKGDTKIRLEIYLEKLYAADLVRLKQTAVREFAC